MNSGNRRNKSYPPVAHGRPAAQPSGTWEMAITGDLGEKQGDLLTRLVEVPRGSQGILYFDSCGGSVYAGLALTTTIRLRGLRATAVVAGECSSAALLPFAACQQRYVTPHSTLLFHPMRWQSDEDVRLEEATEWTRHFQNLEQDLDELLCRLLDFDPQQIQHWTRPGRFVNGRELAAAGLAQLLDLFAGDLWTQMQLPAPGIVV